MAVKGTNACFLKSAILLLGNSSIDRLAHRQFIVCKGLFVATLFRRVKLRNKLNVIDRKWINLYINTEAVKK